MAGRLFWNFAGMSVFCSKSPLIRIINVADECAEKCREYSEKKKDLTTEIDCEINVDRL